MLGWDFQVAIAQGANEIAGPLEATKGEGLASKECTGFMPETNSRRSSPKIEFLNAVSP